MTKCTGHVARKEKMRNVYKTMIANLKEREHLEDLEESER
jgi:hypothetical protein